MKFIGNNLYGKALLAAALACLFIASSCMSEKTLGDCEATKEEMKAFEDFKNQENSSDRIEAGRRVSESLSSLSERSRENGRALSKVDVIKFLGEPYKTEERNYYGSKTLSLYYKTKDTGGSRDNIIVVFDVNGLFVGINYGHQVYDTRLSYDPEKDELIVLPENHKQ